MITISGLFSCRLGSTRVPAVNRVGYSMPPLPLRNGGSTMVTVS